VGGGHGRDGGHYDGGSTGREFVQGLQHNHAGKDLDSSCAVDFVPFIRIWLLDCEDLIGGLALQTAAGHVKFPIATWLQMSVEIIFTEGSQVERCILISWLPRRINTLPPVRRISFQNSVKNWVQAPSDDRQFPAQLQHDPGEEAQLDDKTLARVPSSFASEIWLSAWH